jgi:hypothetical protein
VANWHDTGDSERRSRDFSSASHIPVAYVSPDGKVPVAEFLTNSPTKVQVLATALIAQIASAPPKRFAGGGYWEAMHGDMVGWFEIRIDGPGRRKHYRLFCLIDYFALEFDVPLLVVVCGLSKPVGTLLTRRDYESVRRLGEDYFRHDPRPVVLFNGR